MIQRTSLVTGASRGIGRAIAERLAAEGHHVVGLARTRPDHGFPGSFVAVDLSDAAETEGILAELTQRYAFDHLVNNAGIALAGLLEAATADDLRRSVEVNLRAVMQCAQAVIPGMRGRGFGRIVTLGSRAALGKRGRTVYAATKAGVVGLTRSWALELAEAGITVNCVAPGPIDTEMFALNQPEGSESRRGIVATVPMRRVGTPPEVAAACAFFLSDEAGFITGQTLYVCGGLSVGAAQM